MLPPEGDRFADFLLLAKIGQGAMGEVYKARQPVLDRDVALKFISPRLADVPDYINRLHREAAVAAKLNHPSIVQIHSAGEHKGRHYLVMEYVEGESLQQRLEREGFLPPSEAISLTIQIAQALRYGWGVAGLIHRDVKPENIFLTTAGTIKLGDFGLARSTSASSSALTMDGEALGTPYFISPEQAEGEKEIDCRTDIYSLGCTLFNMLAGYPPYADEEGKSPMTIVLKHLKDPPPDVLTVRPGCPKSLAKLLRRMLAKDRAGRPSDYDELLGELDKIRAQLAKEGERTTQTTRRPRKAIALLLAVCAIALITWSIVSATHSQSSPIKHSPSPGRLTTPLASPLPNLLTNSDFSKPLAAGEVPDWPAGPETPAGACVVVAEPSGKFLRCTGRTDAEVCLYQDTARTAAMRTVRVSVDVRCAKFEPEGDGKYGLIIVQRGVDGERITREVCWISGESPTWKRLGREVHLRPDTTLVVTKLIVFQSASVVDFRDIRLESP